MTFDFPVDFWDEEMAELYDLTAEVIVRAFYAGGMAGVGQLPDWMQTQARWEPFNQFAIDYLHAFRMNIVQNITETTRDQAVAAIANWIQSGKHLDSLIATLQPLFGQTRAEAIGVTEVTRAYAAGNLTSWKLTGFVTEKRWMTAQDEIVCPFCGNLAGQVVELDRPFTVDKDKLPEKVAARIIEPLEYIHPPAHPRCRCWIQPVVSLEAAREQRLRRLYGGEA